MNPDEGIEISSKFFKTRVSTYSCNLCNFHNNRVSHIEAHKHTRKHALNEYLSAPVLCESVQPFTDNEVQATCTFDEEVTEVQTADCRTCEILSIEDDLEPPEKQYRIYRSNQEVPQHLCDGSCPWCPFDNKVSFLLYVLLHSTTHHVVSIK